MRKCVFVLLCLSLILCFMVSCQNIDKSSSALDNLIGEKDGFQYQIVNNAIEITGYNNDGTEIVVPADILGKRVTTIGENAFYQHKDVIKIILPQTLTTIKGSPFYRCYSLQQICIPKNVENIDANPFFRCSSLETICVEPENENFSEIEGVLFDKHKTVLLAYPEGNKKESYTIPLSVKKLEMDSFGYHTKLKQLTILSNVVEFPDGNMFVFPDDIVLVVEANSAAEEYAKKHNLKFKYCEH